MWHNWCGISKTRLCRTVPPLEPFLKDQKVMGAGNLYAFQKQKDYSLRFMASRFVCAKFALFWYK